MLTKMTELHLLQGVYFKKLASRDVTEDAPLPFCLLHRKEQTTVQKATKQPDSCRGSDTLTHDQS